MRRILENALGDEVVVEEVATGERAIERAGQKPRLDLVILDLGLPGLSGLDVLKQLRSDPGTRGLPIVVLSSSREQEDIRNAYDCGANSFVSKSDTAELTFQRLRMLPIYWLDLNRLPEGSAR